MKYNRPYFEATLDNNERKALLQYWGNISDMTGGGNNARSIRNNLIIHILADTGIRLGELRSLEREHANLESGALKINGRHKYQDRTLQLSSDTTILLRHFLALRRDKCQSLIPTFDFKDGFIVKAWPLSSRSIQRTVLNTAKNLGIPKLINPKVFRAMKFFELIEKKTKLQNIIHQLGLSASSREYLRYGNLHHKLK
jgi:integrase